MASLHDSIVVSIPVAEYFFVNYPTIQKTSVKLLHSSLNKKSSCFSSSEVDPKTSVRKIRPHDNHSFKIIPV